jgi:hypothetical protein
VQAALAYIRQHESATQAQVQNFLNTQQLDFSRTNPLTGLSINYKHLEPGSVVDIPRGMQYVQPPGAGNASGFVEILHASLRGTGCRWNAPEWLATASGADMAAYTASLTAHAPFVRTATQKQKSYKQAYTRVIKEAIQVAIDYGRLPPETFDIIDIQCEAPSIPAKSEFDEAQANKIRVQGGWKSRQTVQQEEGLDPQRELQNIEEYNRRMGAGEKSSPAPVQEANFNPNEPRDKRGRWTKVGSGGHQEPTDASGKDLATSDPLSPFVSPHAPAALYTATSTEQPAGSAEYYPLAMSGAVHATGSTRNWDEEAVLEALRKADPDMYEFVKKYKFVLQVRDTGWFRHLVLRVGPLFAVQEIDGQKRNVLQIPDYLDSTEAAMHIAFWLEHDCKEYKEWSEARQGPPKLTAVTDQDKKPTAWAKYVGSAPTPMESQRREAERIAAKFGKELPSNWALKWFGPQTEETGLIWDVLQAVVGPFASAKMAKANINAAVQSAKPSTRPNVTLVKPPLVNVKGTAENPHEPGQATRLGQFLGGGEFEFAPKGTQGVDGVFRPINSPSREVPVSLKSFDRVEKIGGLLKEVSRNANQIQKEGRSGVTLYAEPTNFRADQLAEFAKKGPLYKNVVQEGIITRIIFKAQDGFVEITPKGVEVHK